MTPWEPRLRRVYWESTAGCNLRCIHCRRLDVLDKPDPDELTTAEGKALIDELATFGHPVLVFSGGEPLVRPDIFELAAYAKEKGLPMALATNGTLVDPPLARRLKESGIDYTSVSLDGSHAPTHDSFRGPGAFEKALEGMRHMQEAGIKVQINLTVTRMNLQEVPPVYELARQKGAMALYLFLLVPVGCGVKIAEDQMLSSTEVEEWLQWVVRKNQEGPLHLKVICAPMYYRVEDELGGDVPLSSSPAVAGRGSMDSPPEAAGNDEKMGRSRKGCLAGLHMCFITHKGDVYPCGYLPLSAGNLREKSLMEIWNQSPLFKDLRDTSLLTGRCGECDYKDVCGGCRARGFYAYGDLLAEEPACVYTPVTAGCKSQVE